MTIKHFTALLCCTITAIGSALWLAERRHIIDLTSLMLNRQAADEVKADAGTKVGSTAERDLKPTEPTSAEPPPLSDKEQATGGAQNIGSVTAEETEVIENPGDDHVVRRSKVRIPEEAMNWTNPAQYPNVGDLLRITLANGREYLIEVLSFEVLGNDKGLVVLGSLFNARGKANLMLYENHFSLLITDEDLRRTFNIFYNLHNDYYTEEEIDITLGPQPEPCGLHSHEREELHRAADADGPSE